MNISSDLSAILQQARTPVGPQFPDNQIIKVNRKITPVGSKPMSPNNLSIP